MFHNVCIITGAANGIGRETCLKFLERDYECFCIDKDNSKLNCFKYVYGEHLHCLTYDLMKNESYDCLTEDFKQVLADAQNITLVNNLGGSCVKGKYDNIWDNYTATLTYNLKSLVGMTEIVIPHMKRINKGRIVNVASISGRFNLKTINEDYAAAKGGVIGYSRILASKLARFNILVNTICPGIIGTERIKKRWEARDKEYNESILSQIPLGRIGKPEEVARTIRFLGDDENTYITGAILDINGGLFMP